MKKQNLKRQITSKETEAVIKDLPTTTITKPGTYGFTGNIYRTFYKDVMPVLLKRFHKTKEGIFPTSFYESSSTLIPKCSTRKKLKSNIPDEY